MALPPYNAMRIVGSIPAQDKYFTDLRRVFLGEGVSCVLYLYVCKVCQTQVPVTQDLAPSAGDVFLIQKKNYSTFSYCLCRLEIMSAPVYNKL